MLPEGFDLGLRAENQVTFGLNLKGGFGEEGERDILGEDQNVMTEEGDASEAIIFVVTEEAAAMSRITDLVILDHAAEQDGAHRILGQEFKDPSAIFFG